MIILTIELIADNDHIHPYELPHGYVFRGVIMKWLNEIKPELVHQLHSYEQIRPYSIRHFVHKKIPKIDFSLTTYDNSIGDAIFQDLIGSEKSELIIGNKHYHISQIQFERVDLKKLVEEVNPIKSFNVKFITPTYFNTSMGNYPVRFPLPSLFFGNLANIWNDISENSAEIDRKAYINWVNAHVYLSYYNMRTVKRFIGKPKPVYGGVGDASFLVKSMNKSYYKYLMEHLERPKDHKMVNEHYKENCRWLEVLCKLGEYTNVGANRTAGLGVIRYYPKVYLDNKDLL